MTTLSVTGMFTQEVKTYNAHKVDLLKSAPGKYVVIKGNKIFGIFEDESEAYGKAIRHFGNVPILLRRIQEEDEVVYIGGSALQLVSG